MTDLVRRVRDRTLKELPLRFALMVVGAGIGMFAILIFPAEKLRLLTELFRVVGL